MIINGTQRCSKGNQCHNRDTEIEFGYHNGKINKTCKSCREYHNAFFKKHGDTYRPTRSRYYFKKIVSERKRMKFNHFLKKYNVSEIEFSEILRAQKNACAICKELFGIKKDGYPDCDIDHDHKTGKRRGLLCRSCNVNLGTIESHANNVGLTPLELLERIDSYRETSK